MNGLSLKGTLTQLKSLNRGLFQVKNLNVPCQKYVVGQIFFSVFLNELSFILTKPAFI